MTLSETNIDSFVIGSNIFDVFLISDGKGNSK
jgi:hypothetical protein